MDDSRDSDTMDRMETMLLKDSYKELDAEKDKRKEFFNPAGDIVTVSKDCCVKTLLGSVILGTAFVLIVIAASAKDDGNLGDQSDSHSMISDAPEDVRWDKSDSGEPRLLFRHQYLIREVRRGGYAQIMALDETSQMYVIEVLNERVKFYKQFLVVDVLQGTETFLMVSREMNEISSNYLDVMVLLCQTKKIPRWDRHHFVPTSTLGRSSVFQSKLRNDVVDMEYIYVGDWMAASPFLSIVVNSSCRGLPKSSLFHWGKVDESLACGSNTSMKTDHETCPENICSPLTTTPMTKVGTCHKFRRCNFLVRSCNPFGQDAQMTSTSYPFCQCRRAASADALLLSCPHVVNDGGECEYPRRDLYTSQRTLPCLCQYEFPVVYPFRRRLDDKHDREDTITHEKREKVSWQVRFENRTGPASNFRKCLC